MLKNKKLGIQTYQILTSDDEVCIPSLSRILLAVLPLKLFLPLLKSFFLDHKAIDS